MNRIRRQCSILAAALIVALRLVCTMPTVSIRASVKKGQGGHDLKSAALKTGRNRIQRLCAPLCQIHREKIGTYVFSFSQFRSFPPESGRLIGFVGQQTGQKRLKALRSDDVVSKNQQGTCQIPLCSHQVLLQQVL